MSAEDKTTEAALIAVLERIAAALEKQNKISDEIDGRIEGIRYLLDRGVM